MLFMLRTWMLEGEATFRVTFNRGNGWETQDMNLLAADEVGIAAKVDGKATTLLSWGIVYRVDRIAR